MSVPHLTLPFRFLCFVHCASGRRLLCVHPTNVPPPPKNVWNHLSAMLVRVGTTFFLSQSPNPLDRTPSFALFFSSQRYIQLREMGGNQDQEQEQDDPEGELGVISDTAAPTASKIFPVHAGRAPVDEILLSEHEIALREGLDRVKVRKAELFM